MKKIFLFLLFVLLTSCNNTVQNTQIANPASTNCIEKGGTLEIKKSESGEYGICKLANGRECEEWAYFRGECK